MLVFLTAAPSVFLRAGRLGGVNPWVVLGYEGEMGDAGRIDSAEDKRARLGSSDDEAQPALAAASNAGDAAGDTAGGGADGAPATPGNAFSGKVLGRSNGKGTSYVVVARVAKNKSLLEQVFGVGKQYTRVDITFKHDGLLAVGTPFTQCTNARTKFVVGRRATVVFTCEKFGKGVYTE
jgi:hypothetical protein